MPTTEHIHLPLYTDEETPDLSTTGHYNEAMEILDNSAVYVDEMLDRERVQREGRDAELDGLISAEELARTSADTALGARIDNAETEISANSADLTGIKGLTYGEGGQAFLENEGGEYSSPALEEIRHEISNSGLTTISVSESSTAADIYAKAQASWPNCVLSGDTLYYPYAELPAVGSQAHAYLFTANGGGAASVWIVNATSMKHESDIMASANITFGDFTKAVTA